MKVGSLIMQGRGWRMERSPGVRSQEEHGSEWAWFRVIADSHTRATSVSHSLVGGQHSG